VEAGPEEERWLALKTEDAQIWSCGGGKTERMRQEHIAAEKDGRRWISVDWGFGPDTTVVSEVKR
jgi:hypothetical protein